MTRSCGGRGKGLSEREDRRLHGDTAAWRNVKALNEVSCFGWQGYDENGAETVWRLRWNVECDEGNETFYAKDGRLYRCADGAAVEAFRCA